MSMFKILLAALLIVAGVARAQNTVGPVDQRNVSASSITATGSTTARTLAARAAQVVNIKDHGAVCDGSTDDRTAINAAMTAASAGTAKTVFFPPSSTACMMGSSVTVPANVTLWGYPGTVTVKARAGNVSSALLFVMGDYSTMDGLIIDGGGATFGSSNNVVTAYQNNDVTIQNNRFQNTRGIALIFSTSIVRARVVNNVFYNNGNYWKTSALAADRVQALSFCCGTKANNYGSVIDGNYFEDVGLDAISIDVQTDMQVTNNRFRMDNGQLTQVWTNPQPAAMSAAIYAIDTTQLLVSGNLIDGASGTAIDSFASQNTITGNSIYNTGQAGIGCYATPATTDTNCTITGNQIRNTGAWQPAPPQVWVGGISLGNTPNNAAYNSVLISGNTVIDTRGTMLQEYGIFARSATTFSAKWISRDNILNGNTAALGGALTAYDWANSTTYTASNTWALPANATLVRFVVRGQGGCGGAGGAINVGPYTGAGGGGGGGGSVKDTRWIPASTLSGTATITIAAQCTGAAGGTAGGNGAHGAVGGNASIAMTGIDTITGYGGGGGAGAVGGAGATATGGGGGGGSTQVGSNSTSASGGTGGIQAGANGGGGAVGTNNGNHLGGGGGSGSSAVGASFTGTITNGGSSGAPSGGGCSAATPAAGNTGISAANGVTTAGGAAGGATGGGGSTGRAAYGGWGGGSGSSGGGGTTTGGAGGAGGGSGCGASAVGGAGGVGGAAEVVVMWQ